MDNWWVDDKEPGETPYREKWYHDGTTIFLILISGVVLLLWATW